MSRPKKIAFVGGPGTGKSTLISELKRRDYFCFEEVSRKVTQEAQKKGIDQLFIKNPLGFSQLLLEGRIGQFEKANQVEREFCFFDRGIPEVTAYMAYKNEYIPDAFEQANQKYRYDQVFFFPVWKAIYQSDNERYESYEEALEIEQYVKRTYEDLGYPLILVPKSDLSSRIKFILKHIL